MMFAHCSLIQDGEAALFYRYHKGLKGYMIAGIFIAPDPASKLAFVKIWRYFVSEVVQADDIYSSVISGAKNTLFESYLTYHTEIDGMKIYKVDNMFKDQYSDYAQHVERRQRG